MGLWQGTDINPYTEKTETWEDQGKQSVSGEVTKVGIVPGAVSGPGLGIYGSQDTFTPTSSGGGAPAPSAPSAPNYAHFGDPGSPDLSNPVKQEAYQNYLDSMESAPEQPSIDWDAMYAPAFEAYDKLASTLQGGLPTTIKGIETQGSTAKRGLEAEKASRLGGFTQQRGSAQRATEGVISESKERTKSAVNEARRQQAELSQGIQARFGGTTGTGAFASEILGSQTMRDIGGQRQALQRNIATNTAALQDTLGKITQAENDLKTQVTTQITNIDSQTQQLVAEARQNLQEQLAEINIQKGQLETQKAGQRVQAIQDYQARVDAVNSRNAQFKQQLYRDAQAFNNELSTLKQRSQEKYNVTNQKLSLPSMNNIGEFAADLKNIPSDLREPMIEQQMIKGTLNDEGALAASKLMERLRGQRLVGNDDEAAALEKLGL